MASELGKQLLGSICSSTATSLETGNGQVNKRACIFLLLVRLELRIKWKD